MQAQPAIGVVVVDDHPMTRFGMAFMLKTFPNIAFLGEAENGAEALEVCAATAPDVVLVDMLLGEQDGTEVVAELRRQQPNLKVIAVSSSDDRAMIKRAIEAGAISYVLKNVSAVELVEVIRRAHSGKALLSPAVAQALVEQLQQPAPPEIDFTEREREVLQRMALGQSNGQIAQGLHLSPATVKGHVGAILSKLGVTTRSEAIARAWMQGLVKRGDAGGAEW